VLLALPAIFLLAIQIALIVMSENRKEEKYSRQSACESVAEAKSAALQSIKHLPICNDMDISQLIGVLSPQPRDNFLDLRF
jgi:hypothetical protein